jgi:hypothetical protein
MVYLVNGVFLFIELGENKAAMTTIAGGGIFTMTLYPKDWYSFSYRLSAFCVQPSHPARMINGLDSFVTVIVWSARSHFGLRFLLERARQDYILRYLVENWEQVKLVRCDVGRDGRGAVGGSVDERLLEVSKLWVGGRAGDVFARIPANFVLFVSDKKLNAQHSLNA